MHLCTDGGALPAPGIYVVQTWTPGDVVDDVGKPPGRRLAPPHWEVVANVTESSAALHTSIIVISSTSVASAVSVTSSDQSWEMDGTSPHTDTCIFPLSDGTALTQLRMER